MKEKTKQKQMQWIRIPFGVWLWTGYLVSLIFLCAGSEGERDILGEEEGRGEDGAGAEAGTEAEKLLVLLVLLRLEFEFEM